MQNSLPRAVKVKKAVISRSAKAMSLSGGWEPL
jgi:hypothetical protein